MNNVIKMFAVAISLSLAMVASANTITVNEGLQGGKPNLELSLGQPVDGNVGVFAYANVSENWQEAYVGPKVYLPGYNVEVGVGAGVESNQQNVRFGGYLWAGKDALSILILAEDGGSGLWYKGELKYAIDPKTSVSILRDINNGTGGQVERKLDGTTTLRARLYGEGKGDLGLKIAF